MSRDGEVKFFVHSTSSAGRVAQVTDSSLDNRTLRGVDGIVSANSNRKTNRCSGGEGMRRKPTLTCVALVFRSLSSRCSAIFLTLALTFLACVFGTGLAL